MIDLHCHILPGVDDGAATMEDAVAMARVAVNDGITKMVATPHGAEWLYTGTLDETTARVQEVQAELDRLGIRLELLPGLEAYVAPDLAASTRQAIYTLNSSRYMLVEFPLQSIPIYAEQVLFDLQLKQIVPIIAHPERNQAIAAKPEMLWPMVERGMLVQVTAGSLTGLFGAKTREVAELLLTKQVAHIIASDAHSATWRSPELSAAMARAAELIGQDAAEAMVGATPEAILHDEPVEAPVPLPMEQRRSWFSFLRK